MNRAQSQRTANDAQLSAWMAAARAGDQAAYVALLRESTGVIEGVARRRGVPADRMDDVVRDTLLTIHRARQTYDPASFSAWVRVIAERRAVDFMRRTGRHALRAVHFPLAYERHADEPNLRTTAAPNDRLHQVADLPLRQREAVQHLVLQDRSWAEARAIGRSQGPLKVNLYRALKNLRARLSNMR